MTDEELEQTYDQMTVNTVVGLEWFREEIHRRHLDEQTESIIAETRTVKRLTWAVTILTLANVVIAVALLIDAVR
jgi:hypothetical protein